MPLLPEAATEARRLGHEHVGPEHLLLAVADGARGAGRSFFDRHAMTPASLRECVEAVLGPAREPADRDAPLRIALRSHVALAHAISAASGRHDSALAFTPDELLVALLADDVAPGAVVGTVLERTGLDVATAREEMRALMLSEQAT